MSQAKKTAFLGIFSAVAMVLSYVEYLIPFNFGIPGIKLGLANLVIVFMLYYMPPGYAALVNIVRIVITGLLFGTFFSILFSISGAAVSFLVMWPLSRGKRFSTVGVSIAGGLAHNIGQLIVAIFVVGASQIVYYLPVLLVAGVLTGFINGLIATLLIKHIRKIRYFNI